MRIDISQLSERSDWNMGNYDCYRISEILALLDGIRFNVHMRRNEALQPYYSALRGLYANIRPLIFEQLRGKMDDDFIKVFKHLVVFMNRLSAGARPGFPQNLADDLTVIDHNLMNYRQAVGLGLPTRKTKTKSVKLKEALKLRAATDVK